MAHTHNDECRRLHEMVKSLVAQMDVPQLSRVAEGGDAALFLPEVPASHLESDTSDDGNLDLEIAAARQALEAIGCTG